MKNQSCIRQLADQNQIQQCRNTVKSNETAFLKLSTLLALAGNTVRLKILYLLDEEKELCPCDLSDILGMSVPAISQHLRKMKDGNLIESRREGQTIFYSLKTNQLELLQPLFKHLSPNTLNSALV